MRINHREDLHGPFASPGGTMTGVFESGFRHPSQHHREMRTGTDISAIVWAICMGLFFGCVLLPLSSGITILAFMVGGPLCLIFLPFPVFCIYVLFNMIAYPVYIHKLRRQAIKAHLQKGG